MTRKKEGSYPLYTVRGYSVGFVAPPSSTGLEMDELSLYNRFRFAITYQEDPSAFEGVRITGFDVHPVSIEHQHDGEETITSSTKMSTCNKPGAQDVVKSALWWIFKIPPTQRINDVLLHLTQDLKCLVMSLINLHFKIKPIPT